MAICLSKKDVSISEVTQLLCLIKVVYEFEVTLCASLYSNLFELQCRIFLNTIFVLVYKRA